MATIVSRRRGRMSSPWRVARGACAPHEARGKEDGMAMELSRSRGGGLLGNPIRELARIERELEDVFEQFTGTRRGGGASGERAITAPPLDVIEKKDEIVLRSDLPGLDAKDVQITIDEDGTLTMRGERREEREEKKEGNVMVERWYGSFLRQIALPPNVDAEKISASYDKGVLEIHVPRAAEGKARTIQIQSGGTSTGGAERLETRGGGAKGTEAKGAESKPTPHQRS
jgi:HSP20 family protein